MSIQSHGQVGIAYDALQDGVVASIPAVTSAIKQLRKQTTASEVVFPSWSTDALDHSWQELLMIGGFSRAVSVPRSRTLDHLTTSVTGQSVPVLYFPNSAQAELHISGTMKGVYVYPWDVDGILDLQDSVTQHDGEPLRMIGELPESLSTIELVMRDYEIHAQLANVWRQCFNPAQQIPPISQSESFAYGLVVANAHYGCRYVFDSGEQHLSRSVLGKLTTTVIGDGSSDHVTSNPILDEQTDKPVPQQPDPVPKTVSPQQPASHQKQSLQTKLSQSGEMPIMSTESDTPIDESVSHNNRSVWLQDVDEMIYRMMGKQ